MSETPAGWYPDPQDAQQQRWWDVAAWTEHRQPVVPAAAPVMPPPVAAQPSWQSGSVLPSGPVAPATARDGRAQAKADRAYRTASRAWPLRHPVLLAVGALLGIVIIAVASSSGSTGGSGETAGKVLQHTEDVQITSCTKDDLGYLDAKVLITNHSSKASDYDITIAYESTDGTQQITTGDAFVDSLQPGQSTTQDADSLQQYSGTFKCVVSDAERTAAL